MNRRGFLLGLGGVLAAPAIVRVASIMPVSAPPLLPIYGRSPGMEALVLIDELRRRIMESMVCPPLIEGLTPHQSGMYFAQRLQEFNAIHGPPR